MTQLEALKADYKTLTENQKLFVIVEELDTILDHLAMIQDDADEENEYINSIMKQISNTSADLLDYTEHIEAIESLSTH